MNRKAAMLNLALLALAGLLLWQLRTRRDTAQAHERAVLLKDAQGRTLLAPPAPAPVPPVAPAEYNDSVQKMLFAKDRNPNVIVDPPAPPPVKPAPPPPVMPPLPHYYGQIHFGGDPVIILSAAGSNTQKSYAVGEKIGVFTVLAFDRDSVTFEWNGEPVVRKLAEVALKEAPPQQPQQPQQQAAAAPPPQQPTNSVVAIGGNSGPSAPANGPSLGVDVGGGFYTCKPDDPTPPGTIVDGYRKIQNMALMGLTCRWEKVQ